jgi:hypothetical protein
MQSRRRDEMTDHGLPDHPPAGLDHPQHLVDPEQKRGIVPRIDRFLVDFLL